LFFVKNNMGIVMCLTSFSNSSFVLSDSSFYPENKILLVNKTPVEKIMPVVSYLLDDPISLSVSALNDKVSFFALAPLCHLREEPISCMQKAAVGIGVQELLKMGEDQSGFQIMARVVTSALKSFAFVNSYFCDLKAPETMEFCQQAAGWYAAYYSADYFLNS
jgi:hypothetical protein